MNQHYFLVAAAFLSFQYASADSPDSDSCLNDTCVEYNLSGDMPDAEPSIADSCPVLNACDAEQGGYGRRNEERSLFEEVTDIKKKTDAFNLYLNMQGDFNALWRGNTFNEGKFRMKQLRIEMTGQINDWLSYRYRQRLNKGDDPAGYRDNVLGSIDYAMIGITLGKWQFFLGKQCAAYGGIEFNLNPIEVLENTAITDYMSNFMTGVRAAYNFTPRQQLQFQVLNSLVGSSESMYGNWKKSKMPLLYTLNWNGDFNNFYKTKWSVSFMNETKGKNLTYFALGNEFNFTDNFGAFLDWAYTRQAVDRMGLVTKMVCPDGTEYNTTNVDYMSAIFHIHYRFHPAWNVFAKAIYDYSGIYKSHDGLEKGTYCNSWGYLGGIEYYPFKDRTLHFFAAYIGRSYNYTDRAKAFGNKDYCTNSLSVGFIWQMSVF